MVISGLRCPSNFITAGKLTPARSISVPNECRNWWGTIRLVIPTVATMSRQKVRSLANERVAATRAGEEKAIGREGILGAQQTEAIDQPTNESVHRDQALGFQLAEGHMDGPAVGPTRRRQSKDKSAHSPMRMPVWRSRRKALLFRSSRRKSSCWINLVLVGRKRARQIMLLAGCVLPKD